LVRRSPDLSKHLAPAVKTDAMNLSRFMNHSHLNSETLDYIFKTMSGDQRASEQETARKQRDWRTVTERENGQSLRDKQDKGAPTQIGKHTNVCTLHTA